MSATPPLTAPGSPGPSAPPGPAVTSDPAAGPRGRAVPALSPADIEAGIVPRLRTVVEAQPDAVAVSDATLSLTFAQLAERAGRVAEAVVDAVADPQTPVSMLCGHDAPAVATLLGVVLSGRPLLVMDPVTPTARLRGFVERLGSPLCLADDARAEIARDVASAVAGRALLSPAYAAGSGTAGGPGADPLGSRLWSSPPDPSGVAALGFTSGSTGRPKVVALNHRHLIGDAWGAAVASDCIRPDDVMAHTLPMAFAAGTNITLIGPLLGALCALYDVRGAGIGGLAEWIDRTGVTMMAASPAILRGFMASHPDPAHLRRLRVLTLSGEAVYGRDVAAARRLLPPQCTIYNRYGSTETGLVSDLRVGADGPIPEGALPSGEPVPGTEIILVDDERRPVAVGEPGRVLVQRSYLTTGYWQDPERTAAAYADLPDGRHSFLTNDRGRWDERGRLCLLGRTDHSVKVRGYLVEPGEVDAVLNSLPEVVEAVTVGSPRPDGLSNRLIAYVVSRAERPSAAAVRAQVRALLPGHMVPEMVVFCPALPRNERGKLDRSALPEAPDPLAGEAATDEWESIVAQVWARVLELDAVPRDADFFELGGDSLAAEALVTAVVEELKVPAAGVTPALLVEAPTVAAFAQRLHRRPDRVHQTLTTLHAGGDLPPLFVIAGGGGLGVAFAMLSRKLGPEQPVYALHAHALERRGLPDWSVRAISRRHLATIRAIQPRGPYYLAGHSFGGVIAFDMAQQLYQHGHEVGLLTVLDSFPPDPLLLPTRPELSPLGRAKDAVGLALTGFVPSADGGHYWRFHRQSHFLAQRYRSGPYPGRALVLVTDSAERGARSAWDRFFSGPWRREFVGGDHFSMMREPYVSTVAGLVRSELEAARAATGAARGAFS